MENETIVVNSGPLILLDRIRGFDIFAELPFRFVCPPAVRGELDAGVLLGHGIVTPPWLEVVPLSSPVPPVMEHFLDRGEAEVIQLALENRVRRVCLDDLRGRKTAVAAGLKVMGLLALLGRAKTLGIIPRLEPLADRLLAAGAWYSPKVIQAVLAEVGE